MSQTIELRIKLKPEFVREDALAAGEMLKDHLHDEDSESQVAEDITYEVFETGTKRVSDEVYVVIETRPYECSDIIGVFDDENKAFNLVFAKQDEKQVVKFADGEELVTRKNSGLEYHFEKWSVK